MSVKLAEVIAQTSQSGPDIDIPLEASLPWSWQAAVVEQHCMTCNWLSAQDLPIAQQLHMLHSLALIDGTELVPFHDPSSRSSLLQSMPQLRPLIMCLDSVTFSSLPAPREAEVFTYQHVKQLPEDYEVVLWRTAFTLAKLTLLIGYNAPEGGVQARIVRLLDLVYRKIESVSNDKPAVKNVSQETELLCKFLVKTLLTMMQRSAKRHRGRQHQGATACCLLVCMMVHQGYLKAIIAETLLSSGLILVVMAALQHGLSWSADAFELLHHTEDHLTTEHKDLLEQLHGIKLISSLLRPIDNVSLDEEACRNLVSACLGPAPPCWADYDHDDMYKKHMLTRWWAASFLMQNFRAEGRPSVAQERIEAGLMALAALLFVQDMVEADYEDPAITIPGYPTYLDMEDLLVELAHIMLIVPLSASVPQISTSKHVLSIIRLGLVACLTHLTDVVCDSYQGDFEDLMCALMTFAAQHPFSSAFAEASFGPVMWARASNLISTMCNSADIVSDNPFSLHVLYDLVSSSTVMHWVSLDLARVRKILPSLTLLSQQIRANGIREAFYLSVACMARLWSWDFLRNGTFFNDAALCSAPCGMMLWCLFNHCLEFHNWTKLRCVATARLMLAVADIPPVMRCMQEAHDLQDIRFFLHDLENLTEDACCQYMLLEGAVKMLDRAVTDHLDQLPDVYFDDSGPETMLNVFNNYSTYQPGPRDHMELETLISRQPHPPNVTKAKLFKCIIVMVMGSCDGAHHQDAFYRLAFERALQSAMPVAAAAWPVLVSGTIQEDICSWPNETHSGLLLTLRDVVSMTCLLHEHMWSYGDYSGPPPPNGVARVVYSVLHNMIADTMSKATDMEGARVSVLCEAKKQRAQGMHTSSAPKGVDVERCAVEAECTATRKVGLELAKTASRACEMSKHPAWQGQFDEVAQSKDPQDVKRLAAMLRDTEIMKNEQWMPASVIEDLLQLLHKDKAADAAAKQLLAEEAATASKKAKKQRQQAKKQQAQQQQQQQQQQRQQQQEQKQQQQQQHDSGESKSEVPAQQVESWLMQRSSQDEDRLISLNNQAAQPGQLSGAEDELLAGHHQALHIDQQKLGHLAGKMAGLKTSDAACEASSHHPSHGTEADLPQQSRPVSQQSKHALPDHSCLGATVDPATSQPDRTTRAAAETVVDDTYAAAKLFWCPLTQALMQDPVIAADGHTYERHAMEQWLQHHTTSPVTGAQLTHVRLVSNVLIRTVIRSQQE